MCGGRWVGAVRRRGGIGRWVGAGCQGRMQGWALGAGRVQHLGRRSDLGPTVMHSAQWSCGRRLS